MAKQVGHAVYINHREALFILRWEQRYKEWHKEFGRPKADFDLVDPHPLHPLPQPWAQITMIFPFY